MSCLTLALFSTGLFSVAGVLDKLILDNYAKDSNAYLATQVLVAQIFMLGAFMFVGVEFVYPLSLLAMAAGLIQVIPWIYYLQAVQVEEVSRVSAMEGMYPIFVSLGSAFLLGESLTMKGCIGGGLILGSVMILATKWTAKADGGQGGPSISPAVKYLLGYWAMSTVYFLGLEYILTGLDEWNMYIWSSFGALIAILPILARESTRKGVIEIFSYGPKAALAVLSRETLEFSGIIIVIFATARGSASLVSLVGSLEPLFTLAIVLLAAIFIPGRLREEMGLRDLVIKLGAALMAFSGIIVIQ